MLVYRVFFRSSRPVTAGSSGHATYLHMPQGRGRWDNPDLYDAWYLSVAPEGAVGEAFGNLLDWGPTMLQLPSGLHRGLATFSVPDDLPLFDFDDATSLLQVGMRPSQVVTRNPAYTQGNAAFLFAERSADGTSKWAGVKWWSFHRPTWTNIMLWRTPFVPAPLTLETDERLTMTSPAVLEAARALDKPLP